MPDVAAVLRLFRDARQAPLLLSAYEFFTDKCLARRAAPPQAALAVRGAQRLLRADGGRGHGPAAVEAWLGSLFERGLVTDGTLAQSASQAAELWALREGISESLSATGLPHKNDISLPVAALEAFCAELDAGLRRALPGLGDLPLRPHRRRQPARQRDEAGRHGEGRVPRAHQAGGPRHVRPGAQARRQHLRRARHRPAEEGLPRPTTRTPAELELLRALKRALDPNSILNPGKILDV